MKYYYSLFCIVSLFLTNCKSNNHVNKPAPKVPFTSLQDRKLKGKVKVVRTACYLVKEINGKLEADSLIRSSVDSFNAEGYIIKSTAYNPLLKNARVKKTFYKYDSVWNAVSKIVQTNTDSFETRTKYDLSGNQIEAVFYSRILTPDKSMYINKYDEQGQLIEQVDSSADKGVIIRTVIKYDEKGNKMEVDSYWDRMLAHIKKNKYGANNNVIVEENESYSFGKLTERFRNFYNDTGEYKSEILGKSEKVKASTCTKYSDFDDIGNYLKCIDFDESNKPKQLIERQIEYY